MGYIHHIKKRRRAVDLTKGNIYKTIVLFSLPILLSYLLQNFYSMADAAICGHTLAAEQVAGVGDTGPISFLFLQFAFGCTAGMSVILSNRIGHGDAAGTRKAFAANIVLGGAVCLILTAISMVAIPPLLKLLGVRPSSDTAANEVYKAAYRYIMVICGGMIAQFFYNTICSVLLAIGDSRTPLIFLLVSSVLNIVLDLMFILAFRWGVVGAAAATVASQALSAVGCFIYTYRKYGEYCPRASDFRTLDMRSSMHMLMQGVPLGLQYSVLAFGLIIMQNGIISFDTLPGGGMVEGTPAQLGYGAACRIDNIFFTPLSALGTTMLTFTGQNAGALDYDRVRKGCNAATLLILACSAFAALVVLPLTVGGVYQYIFLAKEKVTSASIRFGNAYIFSAVPLVASLGLLFVWRNCVQGVEKPLAPFLAGIGELVARILVCLFLPRLVNGAPIDCHASFAAFFCLGLADAIAWIIACLILLPAVIKHVYRRKPIPCIRDMQVPAREAAATETHDDAQSQETVAPTDDTEPQDTNAPTDNDPQNDVTEDDDSDIKDHDTNI